MDAEVAIVGAGPVGIELAVALKRRGVQYLHFDGGQVGQTMFWWPPMTRWFSSNERISIAGVPLQTTDQGKCTREDYLRYLRTIVLQFDLQVNTFEPVVSIRRSGDGFTLMTRPAGGSREYRVGRVVLATGGTAAPRKLNVPGEDLPHVSHFMGDPHQYFRRKVLVVGGRNSAVEAALRLQQVAADVAITYWRSEINGRAIKYWLWPEFKAMLNARRIGRHFGMTVTRIEPGEVELCRCRWEGEDEHQRMMIEPSGGVRVPADEVLLMVGYVADMSLARSAGVALSEKDEVPQFDQRSMETNVPGLYVAGTAIAGTQIRYQVFLENCHIHSERIIASIMGEPAPECDAEIEQPES